MSWLSEVTGIHISAPAPIQKLGDLAGGLISSAIPGGSSVGSFFGLGGTGGGGTPLSTIAQQTGANLQARVQTVNQIATAEAQSASLVSALQTPVGLGVSAVVAYLLLRKK